MFSSTAFNIQDGYLDGLCHGFKNNLLQSRDYINLCQCETLDDIRIHLQGTDYGKEFLEEREFGQISVKEIETNLQSKMYSEFNYMRSHAVGSLAKFLDFISYAYMIENVLLLVTGCNHNRPIQQLLSKCHPLGNFEQMESIYVATNTAELYYGVLADTPIATFFSECVSEDDMDDLNLELIRNKLYKAYLEEFNKFCQTIGGTTGEVMKEILWFEADRRSFIMTLNSIGTALTKVMLHEMYPKIGRLHDLGALKRLAECDTFEDVKSIAAFIPEYCDLFENIEYTYDGCKSLEDKFFEHEVHLNLNAFLSTFHYGTFFAYFRLREQEIRNIIWISECVAQNHRQEILNYVKVG